MKWQNDTFADAPELTTDTQPRVCVVLMKLHNVVINTPFVVLARFNKSQHGLPTT
jgi:hypothetical protein